MTAGPEVLAIRSRPRPASALSAVLTLGWRAMLKIKHVPFQLFDVSVMPIMFTLLFTWIFGGALAGTPREYIQYLLPGILVQTIVFITVYTGVRTPESVMTTSFVFLMPLTFASDIFVKLSTMPPWLQAFVRRNPVTSLAAASRKLMHGEPALVDVTWVMVASAAIVLLAAPAAMKLYRKER